MQLWGRRGLHWRVVVYVLVIFAILVWRNQDRILAWLQGERGSVAPTRLSIAGMDLGPALLATLLDRYEAELPQLEITRQGGGTVAALEALLNAEIDVGFLTRLPTAAEQSLFRSVTGDTLSCHPFALAALQLLADGALAREAIRWEELRDLLVGQPTPRFDRLYALDPNLGLWDTFYERMGLPAAGAKRPETVNFWPDARALRQALRANARALGAVSALCDVDETGDRAATVLAWHDAETGAAIAPSDKSLVTGYYPLYHYMYAATRADVSIHGARLVTHLVSDRGQRQVERAGALPVRIVTREILLSKRPLGADQP